MSHTLEQEKAKLLARLARLKASLEAAAPVAPEE